MKIALCYDRVNKFGGAERVLQALHELFPDAPLYTLTYTSESAQWAKGWDIRTSFLQKIPVLGSKHELFPPLAPIVWEQFDFSEFDVVISVTSAEAKSIITSPNTIHICYCLTPTRYYWSGYFEYVSRPGFGLFSPIVKNIFRLMSSYLRVVDYFHAQRPDYMIGISDEVCARIKKYYRRDSVKIYPPVELVAGGEESEAGKYFLVVSRLVPYKRIDIVVEAFTKLGWPLKVVGTGSEMEILQQRAGKNIEFLGQVNDTELKQLYRDCIALVFPTYEDFGIVPVEAQAHGKPVIAYKAGGALETVVDGKTGLFFSEQSADSLVELLTTVSNGDLNIAVTYFNRFTSSDCKNNAERFSLKTFKESIKSFIVSVRN